MRSLLAVSVLLSAAAAQGVLPLSQTMRFGSLGAGFDGPCGPNPIPTVFAEEGTMSLGFDGRFSLSKTAYRVCPGGTGSLGPIESGSGTYDVRADGSLVLEWSPSTPGADPDWLGLRTDGTVAVRTRHDERETGSIIEVAIALSSGKNNASLSGIYHQVRATQRNDATTMTVIADAGLVQFDGRGGWQDQGTRRILGFGGTVTTSSYGPISGTYSVSPDGTVTTGIGALGAVSPDGEVFFWIRHAGTDVVLTVGVRQGASYPPATVRGDWWFAIMNQGIEATSSPGSLRTDWGEFAMQPTSIGGGALDLDLLHVESTPSQTSSQQVTGTDVYSLSNQGVLTFASNNVLIGGLSSDGSMFAGVVTPGDGLGLAFGVSAGRWPIPIGSATAGSGGLAPRLLSIGGFPRTGNGAFGLVVAGGRGGAAAALLLGADPGTGVPLLGGMLWIDPATILASVPLQLSGPLGMPGAGAAGMPFAIAANPLLAGARFVGQAFVVDTNAPQGVAMSAALEVEICR